MAESNIPGPEKVNFFGAKDEDVAEYQKSLNDAITSLQQRYAQPNWFNVAAGLLKYQPGGFAASLGSAGEALGQNLENQRASQLPIAQMRSQLAMSKIAMGQNKTVADMEAARLLKGEPLTDDYVSTLVNTAPNSAAAQGAAAQLKTQRERQALTVSQRSSELTEISAQRQMNAGLLRDGIMNAEQYAKAERLLDDRLHSLPAITPESPPRGAKPPLEGTDAAAAVPPPVAKDAAAAVAGAAAPAAVVAKPVGKVSKKGPVGTEKEVGSGDFIRQGVRPSESVNGEPNPSSTAVGMGQIIAGTRENLQKKYNIPGSINDYATDPNKTDVYDYANLAENQTALAAAKKDPTALNHRVMWWFGTGDGPKILNAKDNATLNSIGLSLKEDPEHPKKDQYLNNGLKADMTVGDLKAQIASQLQKNGITPNANVVFNGMDTAPTGSGAAVNPAAIAAAKTAAAKAEQAIMDAPITPTHTLQAPVSNMSQAAKEQLVQRNTVITAQAAAAEAPQYQKYADSQKLLNLGLDTKANKVFDDLDNFYAKHIDDIHDISNLLREKGGVLGTLLQNGVGINVADYGARIDLNVLSALKSKMPANLQPIFDQYMQKLAGASYYGALGQGVDLMGMKPADQKSQLANYIAQNFDTEKTPEAQYAAVKEARINFEHQYELAKAWRHTYAKAQAAGSLAPAYDAQQHPLFSLVDRNYQNELEKESQRVNAINDALTKKKGS